VVLKAIIDHKRKECQNIQSEAAAILPGLKPSCRSLAKALRPGSSPYGGGNYILECKKASPSKGLIRPHFDLSYITESYAPHASAVSVLTDSKYFQGEFRFVRQASESLTQPILCKDFFLEPAQIQWARFHGADAILLMLSVLSDDTYKTCAAEAKKWNLDILTEVHDEQECRRAVALGAEIIGINNRNLNDLSINLKTTGMLAPLIPKDRILISESGFYSHHDTRELRGQVDGFLVGSSLMEQDSLPQAVKQLIYGRVKVCGLTRQEDAREAEQCGATWGGMILHADSPRLIALDHAEKLARSTPLRWAGIFVNAPHETILETAVRCRLSAVQLHGQESLQRIEELRKTLPEHIEIWKAHALDLDQDIPDLRPEHPVNRFLVDRMAGGQRGGTGLRLDWRRLKQQGHLSEAILAGGLNPDNASQADELGTWALDVSSGLETRPGHKDPEKIKLFFNRLRGGNP